MNKDLLRQKAEVLLQLLRKYSSVNPEAREVLLSLQDLLDKSIDCEVTSPLEWRSIPGAYQFNEGSLRQYGDLEGAFAEFRIEITGGESPALRLLRKVKVGKDCN
ncbi:hypothetical protein [Frateuria defendens]|uniref:hypothetical protein n=1 Tax=Frateuria defendens TaxID=2219559 RepID=UPI001293E2B6|nr:hypothetical protein [Frateuria defendens]